MRLPLPLSPPARERVLRCAIGLLVVIILLVWAGPLRAQVVDSLAHYCPPGSTSLAAFKDTVIVVPTNYQLSLKQSIYLRAIQCGFGKVREVTKMATIRWFSSDTSVVYVTFRTGRATALKPGNATVFAVYP